MSEAPNPFAPARLGPVELRNRIIKAATFEGMTGDQTVSDRLIAFHRTMARGGVGMTTVAFCAVAEQDPRGLKETLPVRGSARPAESRR